jgi:hypothetical protein
MLRRLSHLVVRRKYFYPYQNVGDVRQHSSNNSSFRDTLNNVKKKAESNANNENAPNDKENLDNGSKPTSDFSRNPFSSLTALLSSLNLQKYITDLRLDFIIDNFQQAWDEMTGKSRGSSLKRTIATANAHRKTESDVEDDDDENIVKEKKPSGPSAIVLVKEPLSAWEQMKERLQDSPLIKEILKRSKHFQKVAGETEIGRRAQAIGQNVQDKIEDIREVWETSQNPIVVTASGIWETFTGHTEEGLAINEIRKLDPYFVKVRYSVFRMICRSIVIL